MKKGLLHLAVFITILPLMIRAQGHNGLSYQLSDSLVCKGDSAFISLSGCSSVHISPSLSVSWQDSSHAFLYPDTTTLYTVTSNIIGHGDDTSYVTLTVSSPRILIAAGNVLCHGGQAIINVTASGGIPPYSGTGIYAAPAGTHYYNIADSKGCNSGDSVSISQPPVLAPNETIGSIPCFGDSAPVIITATGGTPPYTGTGTFYVPAGNWSLHIADANGCGTSLSVTVTQPQPLIMQLIANSIRCYGDSALVIISAFGGTPQYFGTGNFKEAPGTHYFVVTDLAGCTTNDSVTITQPAALQINIAADTNGVCAGDTVIVCATQDFVSYFWNSGDTGTCINVQQAGSYYVTVTDQNNCSAESNHLSVIIHQAPFVSVNVHGDTLNAYNATSYQWYANEQPIPGATSHQYIGHTGQEYQVLVTDTNGCSTLSNPLGVIGAINTIDEDKMEVFPNPISGGSFRLLVINEFIGKEIEIFNEQGEIVYRSQVSAKISHVDLDIAKGVYLISISTPNGTVAKRIIKL